MQTVRSLAQGMIGRLVNGPVEIESDIVDEPQEPVEITREDVVLPKCFEKHLAFVLYNVLTPKVCINTMHNDQVWSLF